MFDLPQWINWRLEDREPGKKPAKVPVNLATGIPIDPLNPVNWLPYEMARALDPAHIGFVLTPNDPYFCIDLDHSWNGREWSPLARDIAARFPGAYAEVSFSRDGLHIMGRGTMPAGFGTRGPGIECYTVSRYIGITGFNAQGNPDSDHSPALADFASRYLKPISLPGAPIEWTDQACEDSTPIEDDETLIQRMIAAKPSANVVFSGKASAGDLWANNVEALANSWPTSTPGEPYDRSAADAALAAHLAFWTGKNCARIERLMRKSSLVRLKWDRRGDDYLKRTIRGAVAKCNGVYRDHDTRRAAQIAENARIGDECADVPLPALMTLDEMKARLVFVGESGAVVDSVTHRVRKKEAAADEYAASRHPIQSEAEGKAKNVPALRLWVRSNERKFVDVLAWVPGAPQICPPPEVSDGGTRAFNLWRGFSALAAPDDWHERVRPFIGHCEYLIPVEAERKRFTQWLAHILKAPDILPHTAYLMVTEQTGIGRNLLASWLVRVLRGYVAAGIALDSVLDGGFNGRLSMKLLAIVDEVREGLGDRRYYRAERLKSLITEEHRYINIKYGPQSCEKNCCRWLMFSNHRDALPFENNDRRIIVIENPMLRQASNYYRHLYEMTDDPKFLGSIRRYLESIDLSDFNPGEHAPLNAAKLQSLEAMLSETEKAVIDFRNSHFADLTRSIHGAQAGGGLLMRVHA